MADPNPNPWTYSRTVPIYDASGPGTPVGLAHVYTRKKHWTKTK